MTGFIRFVREQGVVGLAIGFILGGSINKVVGSLVSDIIQPALGMIFGKADGLASLQFGAIKYGNFIATAIDFFIIAAVVYFIFRKFRFDSLDIKKE